MNHWKVYVSSAVFVTVTILKLLLPEQTAYARQEVVELIDMDIDYREIAVQVGKVVTDDSVQQVFDYLQDKSNEVFGETVTIPEVTPALECTPIPTLIVPPTPTESYVQAQEPPQNVLAAVEAFQSSQEAYVGYATPETVSYANLIIPFSYSSPISGVKSSGFGYRVHPIEGEVRFHYGTDYAAEEGTPITAFADGQVSMTGYEKGYGNFVEITHADGWKTLYAHCSEVNVNWYQNVKMGDVIALAGATGETTGPHLHLELMHDGFYTNPEFFF
ncbi:MAG: M23 family metallopeptidase [Oscillospiraceae bacterium]|nr:M23 family metallopeptidase [Oscillospiraceae bacterium]